MQHLARSRRFVDIRVGLRVYIYSKRKVSRRQSYKVYEACNIYKARCRCSRSIRRWKSTKSGGLRCGRHENEHVTARCSLNEPPIYLSRLRTRRYTNTFSADTRGTLTRQRTKPNNTLIEPKRSPTISSSQGINRGFSIFVLDTVLQMQCHFVEFEYYSKSESKRNQE